jgi:hypothetical protein
MSDVRSFVVRVYRQESRGWAGVVETVATGEVRPFHSAAELWALLEPPSRLRPAFIPPDPKEEDT